MARRKKKEGVSPGVKVVAVLFLASAIAGHKQAGHAAHDIVHAAHGFLASAPAGTIPANKQYARYEGRKAYGWGNAQFACLDNLWTGESGWSQYADTRKSGLDPANAAVFAYGIPQSRPATKMPLAARPASLGGKSNPKAQIRWGERYIATNYKTPCSALAFKRSTGNQGY